MDHLPTPQALRKARLKLLPSAFVALKDRALKNFEATWAADGSLKTWQGFRVFAVDGTYLNLEPTDALRKRYGEAKPGQYVQALASFLFDVLNEVVVEACLDSIKLSEKRLLFEQLAHALPAGSVVVLDRLYADYSVLSFLQSTGCHFVIRLPKQTFQEAKRFRASEELETTCLLKVTPTQKALVKEQNWPLELPVRFVKRFNAQGEMDVLVTSLMQVAPEAVDELYKSRWGVESYFDRLKNVFELERWSGQSPLTVEQDFHGVVYLTNLESMIASEAGSQLTDTRYTVNRALSAAAVLEYLITLLLDDAISSEEIIAKLEKVLIQQPLLRAKSGRSFSRKRPGSSSNNRHLRYRKRVLP